MSHVLVGVVKILLQRTTNTDSCNRDSKQRGGQSPFIFKGDPFRDNNLLCRGWRISPHPQAELSLASDIFCYFPNTLHNQFNKEGWSQLLQLIGDERMAHLLLNTTIFIALPKRCYMQISGTPIYQCLSRMRLLRRSSVTLPQTEKPTKNDSHCKQDQQKDHHHIFHKLSNVMKGIVSRFKIFYSNDYFAFPKAGLCIFSINSNFTFC